MLKRKLGLTAWREFSEDVAEGMNKLKEGPMYQKVEETLRETLNEFTNIVTSGEHLMNKTVEKMEDSVEKIIENTSDEISKASRKTSEGFLNAQRKVCQSLNKLGITEAAALEQEEDICVPI